MEIGLEKVLELFRQKDYKPLLLKDLYRHFSITSKKDKAVFHEQMSRWLEEEKIVKDARNRYSLNAAIEEGRGSATKIILTGILDFTRNGNMAFCAASDGNEYVVFPEESGYALHRDLVQIKSTGFYKQWRRAQVQKVLQRNLSNIVGILAKEGRNYFVIPDDKRMGLRYYLSADEKQDLLETLPGEKVIAKITSYPSKKSPAKAKITQRLGSIEDPKVHLLTVIVKHGLPFPGEFPTELTEEISKVVDRVYPKEMVGRKDYREKVIFTIDGETAKDFDDAVGIEKLENGNYLLSVHIADVAHYVAKDSKIDKEALKRGTSTYLINEVIPMLPIPLSNGICSLKEKKNRLTLSVEMEIDTQGKTVHYTCQEGVIQTVKRLTYTLVNQVLEKEEKAMKLIEKIPGLSDSLLLMIELAGVLRKSRKARGAIIEIESGEVEIVLDENGNAIDLIPRHRNPAESLIEEFMIKANETVASIFEERKLPFLYRIHENPDPETLNQLKNYILALGVLKKFPKEIHSADLQKFLETLQDHPLRSSIQRLVVRSMKRAVYSEENIGHYGLASKTYTHFTSPIRRYPDLIVHRLLKEWMSGEKSTTVRPKPYELSQLNLIARQSSQRERVSSEAEWDLISLKKVNYISRNLAEVYQVVVTNVQKFGMFVEIPEKLIAGLIPISTLDDYFVYDEERNVLVGERTKKVYKIGDCMEVRVKDIDYVRGEIDFEMIR